ncbi:hypothetical protein [Vibrio harveyi]|uniref:hypothetical protein n=1 Tax=Vibrio harveyi TaxID=669 RepID=UPI003BB72C25
MSNQSATQRSQASLNITEDGLFMMGKSINLHSTPSPTNNPIVIKDGSISIFSQATADKGENNE